MDAVNLATTSISTGDEVDGAEEKGVHVSGSGLAGHPRWIAGLDYRIRDFFLLVLSHPDCFG
jgi:hypothetical protein